MKKTNAEPNFITALGLHAGNRILQEGAEYIYEDHYGAGSFQRRKKKARLTDIRRTADWLRRQGILGAKSLPYLDHAGREHLA